jgi:DNA modification methylase
MQLLMKPLDQIKPNSRNARTHSSKQEAQIAGSIETYGFHNPILLDEQDVIIAGHGRWAAARKLGMTDIPVIVVRGLSEAKKRGLALADNRIALNAGWDLDILAIELKELSQLDLDFDLEVMGFETAEIDVLIDGQQPCAIDQRENQLPSIPATAVTRLGDLWLLGPHRLLCADAREPASYSKLMAGDRVRVMFADPPYNVKIDGHVCGTGRIRHREFSMAAGEMSEQQFTDFLTIVTKNSADVSVDGAIHFICMDWRHMNELLTAGKATYSELKNLCVWSKDNGGLGSFYRSQHELVFVFKVGTARHINTIELGRSGRYRTNVWSYAGVNTMRPGRLDDLAMHPTVKPAALVGDAIKDCSRRGEIVLDPFSGSGTTIVASEKTGRRAYALEIDPLYVDVAIRRWQDLSGKAAVLEATGQSFEQCASSRETSPDNLPQGEAVHHG